MDANRACSNISEISVHLLRLPLVRPYKVSQKSHWEFPLLITEVWTDDGLHGFGEAVISSGYTNETIDGGFEFCAQIATKLQGKSFDEARSLVLPHLDLNSHATSTLLCAIDVAEGHELLACDREYRVPLLVPCQSTTLEEIPSEVADIIGRGFRTIKVKVGFDVDEDLDRVAAIREAADGQAVIRLDANRAFSKEDACRFAELLPDDGSVVLFEQPCGTDAWDDNSAVAAVSKVPLMLDESIYGVDDIDRAGSIPGVGYVKVKLKKMGSLARLHDALTRIRENGMQPVLGDGVASDIVCWMEACVARSTIDNAGEMNGFLKLKSQMLTDPLTIEDGAIVLKDGYRPALDRRMLASHVVRTERIAPTLV